MLDLVNLIEKYHMGMMQRRSILPDGRWQLATNMDSYKDSLLELERMMKSNYASIKNGRQSSSATGMTPLLLSETTQAIVPNPAEVDDEMLPPDETDTDIFAWGMSRADLYKFGSDKLGGKSRPDILVRWIRFLNESLQSIRSEKWTLQNAWDMFMTMYSEHLLQTKTTNRNKGGPASGHRAPLKTRGRK